MKTVVSRGLPRFAGVVCSSCLLFLGTSLFQNAIGQRYTNSIASTEFDIIKKEDPTCFQQLAYSGKRSVEMPDKTQKDAGLFKEAFVFFASYSDKTKIEIAIDATFESVEVAEKEANQYAKPIGQLPTSLRSGVTRIVVHQGSENTTAFSDVGLIVMYSKNAAKRAANSDLEETLFHESVHAAWDKKYADSIEWKKAQLSDQGYATEYGKKNAKREDLAESALFAYALIHHPDRLPEDDSSYLKGQISHRTQFVESLLPSGKPIFYEVAESNSK